MSDVEVLKLALKILRSHPLLRVHYLDMYHLDDKDWIKRDRYRAEIFRIEMILGLDIEEEI